MWEGQIEGHNTLCEIIHKHSHLLQESPCGVLFGASYWAMINTAIVIHPRSEREGKILVAYLSGATLQAIGDEWGISRERVRQLVRRAGVPVQSGRRRWREGRARIPGKVGAQQISSEKVIERYARVVREIRVAVEELGRSPTYDELALRLGFKHTPSIISYLNAGRNIRHASGNWATSRGRSEILQQAYLEAIGERRLRGRRGHIRAI